MYLYVCVCVCLCQEHSARICVERISFCCCFHFISFHFFVRWQLDSYIYFKLHFWETATHAHITTHSLNNLWIVVFIVFVVICSACTLYNVYIVRCACSVHILPFTTLLVHILYLYTARTLGAFVCRVFQVFQSFLSSLCCCYHHPVFALYTCHCHIDIYVFALSEHIVCIYSDIAYSIYNLLVNVSILQIQNGIIVSMVFGYRNVFCMHIFVLHTHLYCIFMWEFGAEMSVNRHDIETKAFHGSKRQTECTHNVHLCISLYITIYKYWFWFRRMRARGRQNGRTHQMVFV